MLEMLETNERMVAWLTQRVIAGARGDGVGTLDIEPAGKFWLGRLAPTSAVVASAFGDRAERMEPCAVGLRVRPASAPPWDLDITVRGSVWAKSRAGGVVRWQKAGPHEATVSIRIETSDVRGYQFSVDALSAALSGGNAARAYLPIIRVDVELGRDREPVLVLSFVNDTPDPSTLLDDTGIYEATLKVSRLPTRPFLLESLPDSFRYDRRVPAYGVNCGVVAEAADVFVTSDFIQVDRARPTYWNSDDDQPDLSFQSLSLDPLPALRALVASHREWGTSAWSNDVLRDRAREEHWSREMSDEAQSAAAEFEQENQRLVRGVALLESNALLLRSFTLMNRAMFLATNTGTRPKYPGWRPFQVGFLLANIAAVVAIQDEASTVDILWFATGGGKTETYLGLLQTAAFHDRLTGKQSGISAWSRFPLRLLSLQQTQRFADAMAAAEIVRRENDIPGDPFSVGFFVGEGNTPNRIKLDAGPDDPDSLDEEMPKRFQVLLRCPFCDSSVSMGFSRRAWRLEHRCTNEACPWPEDALPFYVVDEEIYRFLPTIVVGTLDKVAAISMQAAMRGFVGAPYGKCSADEHGFVYAPRSDKPSGCLVPGCRGTRVDLEMPQERFPPTFRLQDELHLLRDSLGAIDSHYESLLDRLTFLTSRVTPKIVASSATLTGYASQCETLYCRDARVFPAQGPTAESSFWSAEAPTLLRRFIALAPRGATLEFAADRLVTELQTAVRELLANPDRTCQEIGVPTQDADGLVSNYGTNVVYGNTIRDIEASIRSLETQVPVSPLVTAQLTGGTPFGIVRESLSRLQSPEESFSERIHVVAASSMMSHGVDIDRLNTMVMLGVPLATAEFIQASARIGRRFPGVIFVLHKMALERDASVYRSFDAFVRQGDRFVEAIPITRRSRKVLERTIPGVFMARLRHIHEPASGQTLTMNTKIRDYLRANGIACASEVAELIETLQLDPNADVSLLTEVDALLRGFFRNLSDPASKERFPDALFGTPVMRSLRDVEEQSPIHD